MQSTEESGGKVQFDRAAKMRELSERFGPTRVYPIDGAESCIPLADTHAGTVTKQTRIAAMGSCFAVNIQRWLVQNGYRFVVAEEDPEGQDRNNDVQTFRVGRVFSIPAATQVFEFAINGTNPHTEFWEAADGRLIDPYRSHVTWSGHDERLRDTESHRRAVIEGTRNSDLFIFTIGQCEVWRNTIDGAIYNQMPPTPSESDEVVNLSVAENLAWLERLHKAVHTINPSIRMIVTLSPVPLKVSFREDVHAVVADSVNKAKLRVAIDEFCTRHPEVIYFPAHEIVTKLHPEPYKDDYRHVKKEVVARVMRAFESTLCAPPEQSSAA